MTLSESPTPEPAPSWAELIEEFLTWADVESAVANGDLPPTVLVS